MDFRSEFRDKYLVEKTLDQLHEIITQSWVIMEICGGQTHAIMQYGLDELLPNEIELVHGPGCPVCVTPLELIDKAIWIASQPNVIFTSYGDMLRVPGSSQDLFSVRASGGDVRVVLSPLDAITIAQQNPKKQVVFFAIGFETTAPANAISVIKAEDLGLTNYSILVSQMRVPPAMRTILNAPNRRVQGFLAAGHVCAVMGTQEYEPISKQYQVPIVVTGFEPLDLVSGILVTIQQLEKKEFQVKNAYSRVVNKNGNQSAQKVIDKVYESCDQQWRGIGMIPSSGWCLRSEFAKYDASKKFHLEQIHSHESDICIAGQILQGLKKPLDCHSFAKECTPANPLGAPMVSAEGTCAAYYRYSRDKVENII